MTYIKTSSTKPGVVLIELNRPEKRNALNNATLQNIAACLQDLETDAAVKAVVITGNMQCFAAGFELALHGDMVLTGENAQFALPEIGLDMLPGAGGTQRLARLVGQQLTMRWAMTGEMISAQTALQHGISSQVCPAGLTVQYALELAEKIAKQAPLAIRAIKQSLKSIHEVTL
uniref:Enoyl-CoA hydratase n=1 Tax=Dendroctonus ponderosae TaxID=77166 RepID=A0AAR5QGC0_DENPD